MDKNTTHITPFKGINEKWRMWSGKFMARSGIKGYYVLITGAKKIRINTQTKQKKK